MDSLLDSQNKDQHFSLENEGRTVAEKIQDWALSRESDADDILGLSGFNPSCDSYITHLSLIYNPSENHLFPIYNSSCDSCVIHLWFVTIKEI